MLTQTSLTVVWLLFVQEGTLFFSKKTVKNKLFFLQNSERLETVCNRKYNKIDYIHSNQEDIIMCINYK